MINVEHLLSEINTITNAYEIIQKAEGENFNIYKILGISTYEVKTHSRFLAELLNPNGSHGQGDIFLKLFLNQLNIKNFNTENSRVDVEYFIGTKTTIQGGYIDILITNQNKEKIIIENKIYADDQENQLLRYHNYDQNAKLIYLTLDGRLPKESSTGSILTEDKFKTLSYNNDILLWLKSCRKESANYPILRESISQYIHLINYLTNQSSNNKMSESISEIVLRTETNLSTFLELIKHQQQVYTDILNTKLKPKLEKIANNNQFSIFEFEIRSNLQPFFYFANEKMKENNIAIGFLFEGKNTTKLEFGIVHFKETNTITPQITLIRDKFDEEFNKKSSNTGWWATFLPHDKYRDWNNDIYKMIHKDLENNDIIKDFEDKINRMFKIISDVINEIPSV